MRILLFSWFFFLIPLFQIWVDNNLLVVSSHGGECLGDQRKLLLQLRKELNSTNPTRLLSWTDDQNCCSWDGVECDRSGHVISLELDNETIAGGIKNSSSLFSLQYLQKLNFAYNNFNIQIPREFGNLTNLRYLNLSSAGFIGQIPLDLARLTRLVTLDLSAPLSDVEPLRLESPNLRTLVENLREIRALYLDGVNISARGSEWSNALSSLTNLTVLSLIGCRLYGPIDSSLSALSSLSEILLDVNSLSTTVPDFFAKFSNLTVLSLSSCRLQGQFPQEIFQVPTLRTLQLSNNFITGSLPQLPQNGSLRTIGLSHTNFSGPLPDSIGNLLSLSQIDLSVCNFSGPIPSTMTKLKELVYVDFSWNKFSGPVPSFQMARKLQYLDLSVNNLTGPILPSHFEGLTEVSNINLGYNSLNGTIPQSLFALPSLQKLILSSNQLDGQVDEFPNASAALLDTLDLRNNTLKGYVPKSFFQLGRLSVLSLSSNSFNGTIQLEMVKGLPNLARLELSYNNLSIGVRFSNANLSTFPQLTTLKLASCNLRKFPNLTSQSRMTHLDLSRNGIKGEIPKWIWEVGDGNLGHLNLSWNHLVGLQEPYTVPSSLAVLDLNSNQLQGQFPTPPLAATYVDYSSNRLNYSIPSDIGEYISVAYFFSLANNSLTGSIPMSICNATYLQVLDLSINFLTGSIPECLFQNMEALGVLNLGKNNLSGTIPDRFQGNCVLRTLDLSRNQIEGQIPGSLVKCTPLEVLNVGTNRIKDNFPCKLMKLFSLRVLVLRSNFFQGNLQCDGPNNSWPNLQIIDIASNRLSGNLHERWLFTWKAMMRGDDNRQSEENYLRLEILALRHLYYHDRVPITMKGLEWELQKILSVLTSIDFSMNEFEGSIPETVGDLKALYVLNFSHNALTGAIPKTIGNLTLLGSLDLSKNQLSGRIPVELSRLTFLSVLNLSFNKLVGSIPHGSQLRTFSETSFEGNTGLCGFPLNKICNNNEPGPDSLHPSTNKDSAVLFDFDWVFIFSGLGFGVGAAFVLAPRIVCKEDELSRYAVFFWPDVYAENIARYIYNKMK